MPDPSILPNPSMLSELAKTIPVIVGGLLATGGGFASQFYVQHVTRKREQNKVRRERIESLVKSLYAHQQWLDTKFNTMIFQNVDHDVPSPLDEARMLQSLHFPDLAMDLAAIQSAQTRLIRFIGEQRIARIKDQEAWIKEWDPEPYHEGYTTYLATIHVTTQKFAKLLATEGDN